MDTNKLRDIVYGAAVGDALGVPYEFNERSTFRCTDMVGYGTYHVPAGTFPDYASLLIATCDSLKNTNGNGSLMRIALLALTDATNDEIRAVSAITHAHKKQPKPAFALWEF